jgi:hypothetical protein
MASGWKRRRVIVTGLSRLAVLSIVKARDVVITATTGRVSWGSYVTGRPL